MISHCPRGLFDLRKKRQREVCNRGARGLAEPGQGLCEPGMEEKWKSLLMHVEMAFPPGPGLRHAVYCTGLDRKEQRNLFKRKRQHLLGVTCYFCNL